MTVIIGIVFFSGCALKPPTSVDGTQTVPTAETPMLTDISPAFTPTMDESITQVSPGELPTLTSTIEIPSTEFPPSESVPPTPTSLSPFGFYLQPGTPVGTENIIEPQLGCNWMGIGGQVFDINNEPIRGIVIIVGGMLEGTDVNAMAVSGGAVSLGPGGFVIRLADHPIESDGSLWLQLFDNKGEPKTGRVLLTTYGDCDHNLVIVNWIETNSLHSSIQLPIIMKNSGQTP